MFAALFRWYIGSIIKRFWCHLSVFNLSLYSSIASWVFLSRLQYLLMFLKKLSMGQLQSDRYLLEHQLVERCFNYCYHGLSFFLVFSVCLILFLLQVDKQNAHFFGVTINEQQAESGIVVRVTSYAQSKFKVCIFHVFACNFFIYHVWWLWSISLSLRVFLCIYIFFSVADVILNL